MNEMERSKSITAIIRQYIIAVWTVGLAFLATFLLRRFILPDSSPLFLVAVIISAWRGGLGTGLLATALSALVIAFAFITPVFALPTQLVDYLHLVDFMLAASVIGSLSADRSRTHLEREALLERERDARIQAEEANAVKDEFLAAASHELRTPLTTIKVLNHVLLTKKLSDDERQEYLKDIASECDREIDLVHNLLDVSRIRAGGMQIRTGPVNAIEVIQTCERLVRPQAAEHHHALVVNTQPSLPLITADSNALRRSLCTIVENAIKYTPDGGRISIWAFPDGSDEVAIEVEDNGPGIHPNDMPHVFDRFYRGRATGKDLGGSSRRQQDVPGIGLGLHLARALVEGMNGSIQVRSTLGSGTTFRLQFSVWREIQMDATTGRPV
jgi:signal transduction histidine kinase